MPNYYFDVEHEGASTMDMEGTLLPDTSAALQEARRALGDLCKEAMMTAALPGSANVQIQVRDAQGFALFTLRGEFELALAPRATDGPGSTSRQGDR